MRLAINPRHRARDVVRTLGFGLSDGSVVLDRDWPVSARSYVIAAAARLSVAALGPMLLPLSYFGVRYMLGFLTGTARIPTEIEREVVLLTAATLSVLLMSRMSRRQMRVLEQMIEAGTFGRDQRAVETNVGGVRIISHEETHIV